MTLSTARMICRLRVVVAGAALVILFPGLPLDAQATQADTAEASVSRSVTVADSIKMTLLGELEARHFGTSPAVFSPDRRQFVVVSQRGHIASNTNEFSLLWFASEGVFERPAPRVLATFATRSNRAGISNVQWRDNDTLLLLATDATSNRQVYELDAKTGSLMQQSHHATDVLLFAAAPGVETIVYFARPPLKSIWTEETRRDGLLITDQRLADLLIGHGWPDDDAGVATPFELYVQMPGVPAKRISVPPDWLLVPGAAFVSVAPGGRFAILKCRSADRGRWPPSWHEYGGTSPMAYFVVDLTSGQWRSLLDAPAPPSYTSDVFWLDDTRAVLANVYLPLEDSTGEERRTRTSEVFTVELDARTRAFTRIVQGRHEVAHDLMSAPDVRGELVLRTSVERQTADARAGAASLRAFRKGAGRWVRSDPRGAAQRAARRLVIESRQDMNTPPRLMAIDGPTRQATVLLDPNPQFARLRFGRVSEITWPGTDGLPNTGGLILPPDFSASSRYPLVIQTHGWSAHKFEMDGRSGNAGYAAQALAGKGIIVAQLSDEPARWDGSVEEGPRALATIEGLIDHLDKQSFIDRHRVGLQGWSRTGLHVRHALTFSRYEFAAAVIVDAMEGSYGQYLVWLNDGPAAVKIYEGINGGRPFGPGLQAWMRNATGFNLDRVKTPVRSLAFRHGFALLSEWEWFAGLKYLRVPVELIWLPDAAHAPVRPRERLVAQQGAVDWFCFWLLHAADPDPAKADQYERWRRMRDSWMRESGSKASVP